MQLATKKTRVYDCCHCGEKLETEGPINTFLERITDAGDLRFSKNLFVKGSFEITERGWRARFKPSKEEQNQIKVTIYCYNCDHECEY